MGSTILDILQRHYPADSRAITPEMEHAFRKLMDCRTIELGGHICRCPEHHSYAVLYNSCRQRGCPQCNELRKLQWIDNKRQLLLPVEHNHFVFKLPAQLSGLWLLNKKAVGDILLDCVHATFEQLRKVEGITRGIISVLHTTGRNLAYHPHVHSLVSVGGLTDRQEWQKKYLATTWLENTYRQLVKTKLIADVTAGRLMPPTTNEEIVGLIDRLADREWDFFGSELYLNSEGVIRYLAKHIRGMAVDEKEIRSVSDDAVEIVREYNGRQTISRIRPRDFVIRYLNHIPPKGLVMVRNLGLYSTKRMKQTMELKQRMEIERGITPVECRLEVRTIKCPVCGREMVQSKRYDSFELWNRMQWYLIDGSPPEHGMVYQRMNIAA